MNRLFIFACVMAFAASALFASGVPMATDQVVQPTNGSRDEVIYWSEDFENGQGDWTFVDETAPTEAWHLSTEGAYDGNSWWMGNEDIGGYTNHRYIVLDTPEISLPTGTPELTFMMSYLMEGIGGTSPYNAWDGFNVRVSTDQGDTWTVISGSPTYTATSFYSFGFEFGEGPDIPGYGGDSDGWVSATFPLTAYAGDDVMIRFAFASDPSSCTDDGNGDESWFGVRLDDIDVAGVFASDGDGATGDSQMVPGTLNETAGNFWDISDAQAHSGTEALHCSVSSEILNGVISPFVELPAIDELYFGYWVYCDMLDSDGNDDNSLEDYYLVYVRPEGSTSWTRLHYLFNGGDTGGVYGEWSLVNEEFAYLNLAYQDPAGTCDISQFSGQNVQFRFVVTTDDNDDGGVGTGLFLDDMMVYSPVFLPQPLNPTAEVNEDFEVELAWESPFTGGGEGWIHWDDGTNTGNGIGVDTLITVDVAARFDANDLLPYIGSSITTIKFWPNESTTFAVKIWESGSTELLSQAVANVNVGQWNEITLDSPLEIEFGQELWIGYSGDDQGADFFPFGCDAGPQVPGKGALIRSTGGWRELGHDYNWNIQAYVDAATTNRPLTRDITGYKVYRTLNSGVYGDPIATIADPEQLTYVDDSPEYFATNYYSIVATYDNGDSPMGDEVSAFVLSPSATIYSHDDGEAESGSSPATGAFNATYFEGEVHPSVTHVTLEYVMAYFEEVEDWDAIIKVWDNDGEGGMPGTELLTFVFPKEDIIEGDWTYIPLTDSLEIADASFYIGIQGVPSTPTLGVDDSVDGWSYINEGTGWAATDGCFMLRAIIDRNTGIEEEILPVERLAARNYPNPFNPETTIHFNLPEAGQVDVRVYNVRGQLVKNLQSDTLEAGRHSIVWHGQDNTDKPCASGLYFYRIETANSTLTQKMMLLK